MTFDPKAVVENSEFILDNGEWPNFHDAEVHRLNIWRGDIRPPFIRVRFEQAFGMALSFRCFRVQAVI